MTEQFCRRTARKIKKLGYAPELAARYSRFFCISMLSVGGIMVIGMCRRKGVKCMGEETPRSLRHTLATLIASINRSTGAGISTAGPAADNIIPASFRIHSN